MNFGPIQIGPAEVVVAILLGLIASVVLVTVLILLLWGIALLVVAPTMSTVTARIGRRRRHAWLRDQWLSVPEEAGTPEPPQPDRPPVCGVSVVCDHDLATHIDFLAAQVRPESHGPAPESTTMGMFHAVVRRSSQLNLLPHPDGQVAVLVLAGRGTAGVEQQPVCAGQLAIFGPDATITMAAGSDTEEPLEVLVLGDADTEHAAARGEVVVVERSAALQRRLAALKTLADASLQPVIADDETPATADHDAEQRVNAHPVRPDAA